MTPARQQQLLQNQTSLARKVYDAVPTIEPWAASRIKSALDGNHAFAVISGALSDLKKQGLIKEVSRLRFIRVEVKATLADQMRAIQEELQTKDAEPMQQQKPPARNPRAPVDQNHREAQRQFALAQQAQDLVECDACPTSGGCVGTCMKSVDDQRTPPGDPAIYAYDDSPAGPVEVSFRDEFEANRDKMKPEVVASVDRALAMTDEQVTKVAHGLIHAGGVQMFTQPQAGKPATAFERLFELSQKVRSTAAAHHNAMADLADGLEAVAVEIGTEHEANAERTEQLRKLKLALNAIGDL